MTLCWHWQTQCHKPKIWEWNIHPFREPISPARLQRQHYSGNTGSTQRDPSDSYKWKVDDEIKELKVDNWDFSKILHYFVYHILYVLIQQNQTDLTVENTDSATKNCIPGCCGLVWHQRSRFQHRTREKPQGGNFDKTRWNQGNNQALAIHQE